MALKVTAVEKRIKFDKNTFRIVIYIAKWLIIVNYKCLVVIIFLLKGIFIVFLRLENLLNIHAYEEIIYNCSFRVDYIQLYKGDRCCGTRTIITI